MSRFILTIILVGAAIASFVVFTNPHYQNLKQLQVEGASYDDALNNSREFEAERSALSQKRNSIKEEDLARLKKLLPDSVDNIRLIIELDAIAAKYGMKIKNTKYDITQNAAAPARGAVAAPSKDYGSIDMEFSIDGSYSNFLSFLGDVEQSLRIVDINSITFTSIGNTQATSDKYTYDFKIKTYWLKG